MAGYVRRRASLTVVTVLAAVVLVSLITRVAVRGDTVDIILAQQATPNLAQARQMRHELGLDRSPLVQSWIYIVDLFKGDLGDSLITRRSVASMVAHAFSVSVELALIATVVSLGLGVPLGTMSAVYHDSPLDHVLRAVSIVIMAAPGFWLARMLITYGQLHLGYVPPFSLHALTTDPVANLKQFAVPGVLLGASSAGVLTRLVRTEILESLRQDYVRTASAKGLSHFAVVTRHVLRNSLIPIVTLAGLQIALLLGGAVIFEQIFLLPGMGRLLIDAINNRDYPVLQGCVLVFAAVVVVVNLAVDLSYAYLDPRVSLK